MTKSISYDRIYYERYKDQPYGRSDVWLRLFSNFAAHIVRDLQPKTALDAGCAMGLLVEAMRNRGVEAYGLDISPYAISEAREDLRPFLWEASLTDPLDKDYDVIICLEVLEHLSPGDAELAVQNLCGHTSEIIFSSTPDEFKDPTHLNVRPADYWAELFARYGMYRDTDYEPDYISTWAVRFRRGGDSFPRIVKGYERLVDRLARENRELREVLVERNDAALEAETQLAPVREELAAASLARDQLGTEVEAMKTTVAWRLAEWARHRRVGTPAARNRLGHLLRSRRTPK